ADHSREIQVDLVYAGAGQVADRDDVGAAAGVDVHGLDVHEVQPDVVHVAGHHAGVAVGRDVDPLRDVRAVKHQTVRAGPIVGHPVEEVVAVARVPYEDVVAGVADHRVVAGASGEDVVAAGPAQPVVPAAPRHPVARPVAGGAPAGAPAGDIFDRVAGREGEGQPGVDHLRRRDAQVDIHGAGIGGREVERVVAAAGLVDRVAARGGVGVE